MNISTFASDKKYFSSLGEGEMKKYIFWTIFVFSMGFFVPFLIFLLANNFSSPSGDFYVSPKKEINLAKKEEQEIKIPVASVAESVGKKQASNKNIVSLLFVGDIMFDRGVKNSVVKNGDGDYAFLFKNADFIKDADISFGNLEGPISDKGKDLRNLYSFRFEPFAIKALKNNGFDVLSVANNHIGDWGKVAFEDTISRLDAGGIITIGGGQNLKDAGKVKIIEKNGFRIGFLSFSDAGPDWLGATQDSAGILITDDENFSSLIREAAPQVDILVVSLHFGEEYQGNANDRQKKLAHLAIDSGAKIVVGHHPHVVQEVEQYKNGVIAYSLGNFIFDQNFSKETMQGLALEIVLDGAEIISVKQNKIKINEFFQPQLAD